MSIIDVPAFTVCGTTMARHSLPVCRGVVAVFSGSPLGVTMPVARSMVDLRTRLVSWSDFSISAQLSALKPSPITSVTLAQAMRWCMAMCMLLVVGAMSADLPHRKSLAS